MSSNGNLKSNIITSLRVLSLLTLVLGVTYPVLITLFSQIIFKDKANGSLITLNGKVIGSSLIAQKTESEKYLWPRPSASDYGAVPSGASNLGATSEKFKLSIQERKSKGLVKELLFSSGSGIDPHISLDAALSQVPRIVQSRKLGENEIQNIISLIHNSTIPRDFGFLGEPRINVLLLNIEMDKKYLE